MDIFTWLAGMPSRVIANVTTRQHVIEVEDEASALLEYENGAIGYFLETVNEYPTGIRIELCGERGKLALEGGQLRFWEVTPGVRAASDETTEMWGRPEAEEVEVELEERQTGHAAIIRNVVCTILHQEPLISPGPEAIRSLELANAILLSGHKQATSKDKDVQDQRITDPHHLT
jgi:predicted dehydrogenase